MRFVKTIVGLLLLFFSISMAIASLALFSESVILGIVFSILTISVFMGSLSLIGRGKNWRKLPATEKQKDYATDLGIRHHENITRGELSDLITDALQRFEKHKRKNS